MSFATRSNVPQRRFYCGSLLKQFVYDIRHFVSFYFALQMIGSLLYRILRMHTHNDRKGTKKLVSSEIFKVNESHRVKWLSIFVAKEPIRRFVWIVTQHEMHHNHSEMGTETSVFMSQTCTFIISQAISVSDEIVITFGRSMRFTCNLHKYLSLNKRSFCVVLQIVIKISMQAKSFHENASHAYRKSSPMRT